MKDSITTDLLKASIEKETREAALKVLKEKMSGRRFDASPEHETFFYWLDEDEIPLIIDAMIEFRDQNLK